jgi:hypothetical protein
MGLILFPGGRVICEDFFEAATISYLKRQLTGLHDLADHQHFIISIAAILLKD